MLKTRILIIFICSLLPFIYVQPLLAGITGKIAGHVVDSESGEPIPGANIIIEGTAMGEASDLDGYYTILQVPPDVYTVTAAVIGYGKVKKGEEGLNVLSEAQAVVDNTGAGFLEAELHRTKGELLLLKEVPDVQGAEKAFLTAIDISRRKKAKSLELRATVSLSRLWIVQGKRERARNMLSKIYSWFTEGFDTADLREAKALIQELS